MNQKNFFSAVTFEIFVEIVNQKYRTTKIFSRSINETKRKENKMKLKKSVINNPKFFRKLEQVYF